MAITPLPFLYQTRTLQRLSRAPTARIAFRSLLHTTAHRSQPAQPDHIPFELPPDVQDDLENEPEPRGTITPGERAAFEAIFDDIAARKPRPRPSPPQPASPPARAATEPDEELKTLRRQWTRPLRAVGVTDTYASVYGGPGGLPQLPADRDSTLARFPPSLQRAARLAMGIVEYPTLEQEKVVGVGNGNGPGDKHPVKKWPATGAKDTDMDSRLRLESEAKQKELERLRLELRHGIETRMMACKRDFQLWATMETEVFPLVDRLGLSEARQMGLSEARQLSLAKAHEKALLKAQRALAKARRKGRLDGRQPTTNKATMAVSSGPPRGALDMHTYGPCYPSHLLVGLRLFDGAFARSSPLALSILPRIKELGLASYVLGVSTPFYNSLMAVHWERYGDAAAVIALLEEMRHAGLSYDENTLDIVEKMETYIAESAEGGKGRLVEEIVASVPQFEEAAQGIWSMEVSESIIER